jgi:macrolide transport system ATP-binding/permease protein
MSPLTALVARDLVKAYAGRPVLDGVDLVANPGEPVGLVGENGVGKSTLLRLLAGVEPSDSGSVQRPADVAYLSQDPEFPPATTVGAVLGQALAPLHRAVERLEELSRRLTEDGVHDEYDDVLAWAGQHDAWDADRRSDEAAHRLGLADIGRGRRVSTLSGGERTRLVLAAIVTRRPDCVLLDEPTNHLDDDGIAMVEDFCREVPGVVVVASHDRVLLDRVTAVVVDLDDAHFGTDGEGGNRYRGGFSGYLHHKHAARARWEHAFAAQQDEVNELRYAVRSTPRNVAPHNRPPRDNDKFIYRFKGASVDRTVARRVRNAQQRLDVLERDRIPKPPRTMSFGRDLAHEGAGSGPAVVARDLVVTGRLTVPRIDVDHDGRLLVTGANGTGKSTLLLVLAGRLSPTSGTVAVHARRVGMLPQDVCFARPDLDAHETYRRALGAAADDGPLLGDLGLLHPRDLGKPVGNLSVGQQRRLRPAVLVARRPDLLLLDEPTNHISLVLADELESAMEGSPGAIVVTSHDRWLRRRWSAPQLTLSR